MGNNYKDFLPFIHFKVSDFLSLSFPFGASPDFSAHWHPQARLWKIENITFILKKKQKQKQNLQREVDENDVTGTKTIKAINH